MAANLLSDSQKAPMVLKPVDAAGNPAVVEGIAWASTDDTIIAVAPDATDPTKCDAVTTGKLGLASVRCDFDAKIGDGVTPLSATADFEIVAGEAVSAGLEVGAAVPK